MPDVANGALMKLWNIGKESLGKPFLGILPEMKHQGFHELMLVVYRTGATHSGDETPAYYERAHGSSEKHYFDFIYQPCREGDGVITGVLMLATDVTGWVLTKQKLAQSEQLPQHDFPGASCHVCGKGSKFCSGNCKRPDVFRLPLGLRNTVHTIKFISSDISTQVKDTVPLIKAAPGGRKVDRLLSFFTIGPAQQALARQEYINLVTGSYQGYKPLKAKFFL